MQAAVKKKRPFDDFRRHKTYYFMLIPMVVFFLLFCYLPMPGLYYAFVDYDFMQGLRSPFLLLLRSLPVSHGPTGIFLFIAVVFPSCCLLVYRYLANMSSRYLHSLTYHYSNNISCYNIRSLVYHYPKNVSCQYLHGLTCHNPSNIGENPGLPPDCHLLCLLLALTIHVYI